MLPHSLLQITPVSKNGYGQIKRTELHLQQKNKHATPTVSTGHRA